MNPDQFAVDATAAMVAAFSLVGLLLATLILIVVWMWKRHVNRVDILEREKANKESTDARFDSVQKQLAEHIADDRVVHGKIHESIEKTNSELHQTNLLLTKIAAQQSAVRDL